MDTGGFSNALIASTGLGALFFIGTIVVLIGKPGHDLGDDHANRDGRPPSGRAATASRPSLFHVSGIAGIPDAFAAEFGDVVNCPKELRLPSNKVGGDLGKAGEPVTHTHKTTPIRTSEMRA